MPTVDRSFCTAVLQSQARITKVRETKDTCPREQKGCGKKGALCSVAKRGMTLARFCPYCGWSTMFLDKQKGRATVKRGPR